MSMTPVDGMRANGALSNDSGVVRFTVRATGRYVLQVRRIGYSRFTREVTVREGGGLVIDVELGEMGPGLNPTRCACEAAKVCM